MASNRTTAASRRRDKRTRCICVWQGGCSGTGVEHCAGCGGDACICRCGGERPCLGCDVCEPGPIDLVLEEDLR